MTIKKPSKYKPVPVSAAEKLAEEYDKNLVVILTWDRGHNTTNLATYGTDALTKDGAARVGQKIEDMLGLKSGKGGKVVFHEDFRATPEAVYKEQVDRLRKALQRFVSHTKLLSNRWPCPECGRKSKDEELLGVSVLRMDRLTVLTGCWYCNIEPVLEEAERALNTLASTAT